MVGELESAKEQARVTYNAASDAFDAEPLSFWDRFGRRTIERLDLAAGDQVLDVCSGSGASAIPAAERVGPSGRVVAVDLAERLLELARAKCRAKGLAQVEFRVDDMQRLGYPDQRFDAVVCVFGIFFVPDMARAVRELWRMVRPGGQLAITTWGPELFEPASSIFWEAVRGEDPALYKGFHPWDRINTEEALSQLMSSAGVANAVTRAEEGWHELGSPEDWWQIVLGTGYRGTLEALSREARERMRRTTIARVSSRAIKAICAGVVYGLARKPALEWLRGLVSVLGGPPSPKGPLRNAGEGPENATKDLPGERGTGATGERNR